MQRTLLSPLQTATGTKDGIAREHLHRGRRVQSLLEPEPSSVLLPLFPILCAGDVNHLIERIT